MAKAGFYAVESGRLSFRHDGNWYTDEERIDNPRIALLFSQSIRRNPDGSYYLQVAEERAPVRVEDTPYVVKAIEETASGAINVITNDGEREPLDPSTLESAADNVFYCRVKDGRERARFLRSAYYHLSDHFMSDDGETFFILIGNHRYPVRIAEGVHSAAGQAA